VTNFSGKNIEACIVKSLMKDNYRGQKNLLPVIVISAFL